MNKQINGLVAAFGTLGVALLLSGPAWSLAEQAPAEAKPAATPDSMTLEELDTIVVNAKRFEDRLFNSEQVFYRLYNQLNAKEELDVTCDVWLADTRYGGVAAVAERRYCLPKFLAESIALDAPYIPVTHRSCRALVNTPFITGVSTFGGGFLPYSNPNISSAGFSSSCIAPPATTPVRLISMQSYQLYLSRRDEFEANLNKVMRADPQLQVLGERFQMLVEERDETRRVAAEARKLRVAMRWEQRKCPAPISPRSAMKACKSD